MFKPMYQKIHLFTKPGQFFLHTFFDHCKLKFAYIICQFNLWSEKFIQWRMTQLCQNYYYYYYFYYRHYL